LAVVTGVAALLGMFGNPFFGKLSDRTTTRLGMRRPWMVIGLVAASLLGGRLSDRTGRRKVFVLTASVVYGLAMFVLAVASDFNGFLVGMAIAGSAARARRARRAPRRRSALHAR
jgi:MFS family permease